MSFRRIIFIGITTIAYGVHELNKIKQYDLILGHHLMNSVNFLCQGIMHLETNFECVNLLVNKTFTFNVNYVILLQNVISIFIYFFIVRT